VGKIELLPEDVREAINIAEESTAKYNKRQVNIAIGYDGRHEMWMR
jgi:tritrans,polycis-undecaprenyl-diphosphate synthase [geranylgeranyl-diphosphate specific]